MTRSPVEEDLHRANVRLRAELLCELPTLTMAEVDHKAAGAGAGQAGTARSWLRERRIFGVEVDGTDLVPAFQFDPQGQPRPVIREILAVLPGEMTPWQTAAWFVSANGWLDGAYPCERLDDEEAVLAAARQLADGAVG